MIEIDIPGSGRLTLAHLVADYNGTLARDGQLAGEVSMLLNKLADLLDVHVITADTFGSVERSLKDVKCKLEVIGSSSQDRAKLDYVKTLGADTAVCIGNGRNDVLMLQKAALGIAVISCEGMAGQLFQAADIFCSNITDALELLRHPLRLKATLRR